MIALCARLNDKKPIGRQDFWQNLAVYFLKNRPELNITEKSKLLYAFSVTNTMNQGLEKVIQYKN